MRQQKEWILNTLSSDFEQAIADDGGNGGGWLAGTLNNARLASLGLYEDHVDAFRFIFAECDQEFACFYERAEVLAAMEAEQRAERLQQLAAAGAGRNQLVNQ
jgi:predicted aminopeptidase